MAQVEVVIPHDSECPEVTWELIELESLPQKPILGRSILGYTDKLVTGVFQFQTPGIQLKTPMAIKVTHEAVSDDVTREINVYQTETADNKRWNRIETTTTVKLDDSDENNGYMERTLIFLKTVPSYLAVVNQVHTEYGFMDRMGGSLISSFFPGIEIKLENGSVLKQIEVGLSVQSVSKNTLLQLLGQTKVHFSPVLTLKPFRRKFHKAIKVSIPVPGLDSIKTCVEASKTTLTDSDIHSVELVEKKPDKHKQSSSFLNFFLCGSKEGPVNNEKTLEKDIVKKEIKPSASCSKVVYKALPASVRLMASINPEEEEPHWEDITATTPVMLEERDIVMFHTTCSARFCVVIVDPGLNLDVPNTLHKIYKHISLQDSESKKSLSFSK